LELRFVGIKASELVIKIQDIVFTDASAWITHTLKTTAVDAKKIGVWVFFIAQKECAIRQIRGKDGEGFEEIAIRKGEAFSLHLQTQVTPCIRRVGMFGIIGIEEVEKATYRVRGGVAAFKSGGKGRRKGEIDTSFLG
jgi:hypothetical protein